MEALNSSVHNPQLLDYAWRVGFVNWEISKNWAWILMNVALVVTVMWAFGNSWRLKHAQSRPISHSIATMKEESTTVTGKESTGSSTGITEGGNKSMGDSSQGRIYVKFEGSFDEFTLKKGIWVDEAEVIRGRNPVLCSYSLSDNKFFEGQCMGFVYSIGMPCSRDNVISVWDNGVGKCIHDTKLGEYAISVEGNCFIQNSPKSVLLSSIVWSGGEKSRLCLWDRRQPAKAISFPLEDELALLHAVEFNDSKICVSDGLNDKLFDLRMAAAPVVEAYPTSKRFIVR